MSPTDFYYTSMSDVIAIRLFEKLTTVQALIIRSGWQSGEITRNYLQVSNKHFQIDFHKIYLNWISHHYKDHLRIHFTLSSSFNRKKMRL